MKSASNAAVAQAIAFFPSLPIYQPVQGQRVPPEDFVVSRYADGRVASRYGNLLWDWTPYSIDGRREILNFKFWKGSRQPNEIEKALLAEMRWVLYLMGWKRRGATFVHSTLLHFVKAMRSLARHCVEKGLSFAELFSSSELLFDAGHMLKPYEVRQIATFVSAMVELGPESVGFAVAGGKIIEQLRKLAAEYAKSLSQIPPIPTRIYSFILGSLSAELDDFEKVADKILALARRCINDEFIGRTKVIQWKKAKRNGRPVDYQKGPSELFAEYGVTDYFQAKSLPLSVLGISSALSRMQMICRLSMHSYSGMRDEEAERMLCGGLNSHMQGGKTTLGVCGHNDEDEWG